MTIINPNTLFIGKNFIILEECDSTNSYALDVLTSSNIAEGTIIYTNNQFSGKGQQGNKWVSEPNKNLTFSMILMPKCLKPTQQFYLNKLVSISIIEILNENVGNGFEIKWPNDIYYEDKKVGGILIENSITKSSFQQSVIGIGLNVNQENFDGLIATSLSNIKREQLDLKKMLESFCERFEANYLRFMKNPTCFDRMYLDVLYRRGEKHRFNDNDRDFEGEIIGVDELGKLVLEREGELKKYNLKEIKFI